MKNFLNFLIGAVLLLGLVNLVAWAGGVDWLLRPVHDSVPMNPITALCFLLISLSFLLINNFPGNRMASIVATAAASATMILCFIKILTFVGVNTGIDNWLFNEKIAAENSNFGQNVIQIAPGAVFGFMIMGFILLCLQSGKESLLNIANYGALAVLSVGILSFLGYINHLTLYYNLWTYLPLPAESANAFLLLSSAFLCKNGNSGFMQVVNSPHSGGKTARRLITGIVIITVIFSYMRGYFLGWFIVTPEFGLSMLTTSIDMALFVVVWGVARALNNADLARFEAEKWQQQYLHQLERINSELQESEERYQKMVAEVQDYAILLLSKEGKIVNWNKGAEKIEGYKAEEIIGKKFSVFYPAEALKEGIPDELLHKALTTGRASDEGWRVKKDGTRFWASSSITALRDDKNEIFGFSKVTRDLTARKNAEDQLQRQADLFRLMPDAVIYTERDHSVLSMNAAAEQMFEVTEQEAKQFKIDEIAIIELVGTTRHEVQDQLWGTRDSWRGEAVVTTKSGKVISTLLTLKATKGHDLFKDCLMGIFTDITLLRMNAELKQALGKLEDSNNYLEQLAYVSAHDLKSPILTVDGLVHELIESGAVKEEHREVVDMVLQTVEQMKRTNFALNDILKLRKNLLIQRPQDAGEFMPLGIIVNDVKAILQNSLNETESNFRIELNGEERMKFPYYHLKSIIYNLVFNSIKYADPQRKLTVLLKAEALPGKGVAITIEDNGLGMDLTEYGTKIFGIFRRFHNHVDGAGVGLHIVKSIVDAYGGNIEVQSMVGKGTRFIINFDNTVVEAWN